MTTTQARRRTDPTVTAVPDVLTEDHHEAIKASWELPAYEREEPPNLRSAKPLVVGILAGAVSLAVGFGAGYWAHSQTTQAASPFVITRVAGPVDANGMNLGRRLAPFETALPNGITLLGPVDADGGPLGRRVPPLETHSPNELPGRVATDANGMTLGRRVAPFDETATTQAQGTEADTVAFGRHGGRP